MKAIRFGKENPLKKRRIKGILKKLIPITFILGMLIGLAIFLTTLSSSKVVKYIFTGSSLNSTEKRVNVLLLGIAGGTHAGSSLTDTILVASYNLKTDEVFLFSVPRDLWLPSLQSKANAVYQMGLNQGNGLGLTKTVMENVLGIPIHYGIRIDFRGFTQAIDALGGIDVEVDRSFDDFNYPLTGKENDLCGFEEKEIDFTEEEAGKLNIPVGKRKVFVKDDFIATDSAEEDKGPKYFSCRYEHIKFTKGQMHMDGELALKFVRSRHGTSGESSDFARSKRQQKVLEAVRTKVLSLDTLTDPQKVKDLISALGKSIDTDISFDALEFYKLSKDIKSTQNIVIDDSLLIHPNSSNYGGAYVLISQDDDFSTIHDYIRKVLSGEITEYEATSSARGR